MEKPMQLKIIKTLNQFQRRGLTPYAIYLGHNELTHLKMETLNWENNGKFMGFNLYLVDKEDHFNIAVSYVEAFSVSIEELKPKPEPEPQPQPKYKKLYEMQRKRSQRAERALIEFCEKLANPAIAISHIDFKERYDEARAELTTIKRRIAKFKTFHLFGRFWFGIEKDDKCQDL